MPVLAPAARIGKFAGPSIPASRKPAKARKPVSSEGRAVRTKRSAPVRAGLINR